MSKWANLYCRNGSCVPNPTDAQLKAAIREVFTNADQEHPDTWIECGSSDGPLHILAISSGGTARYTKYSDEDMTEELDTSSRVNLTEVQALQLWMELIADQDR